MSARLQTIAASLGSVRVADLLEVRVAGDVGEHADAALPQQRLDELQVAGDVVLADERDVGRGGAHRLGGADDVLQQHLARDAVAQVLGADEAGRVDRDDRHPQLARQRLAGRLDVLADKPGHARRVDEDRGGLLGSHDLAHRGLEPLLATVDDVELGHVGGEASAVQVAGGRVHAAALPRVARAVDGAVHDVSGVGDGHQHDRCPVEGAALSAARPAQLVLGVGAAAVGEQLVE